MSQAARKSRPRKAKMPTMDRDDLSFTGRVPDPEYPKHPRIVNWLPPRVPLQINQWNVEKRIGAAMIAELMALQAADEQECFDAIWCALASPNWQPGYGAEHGFSQGIAGLAILGMRAIAAGAAPFVEE
ncbi:hypothetical protein [Pseudomonas sp. dw_358]|uniref:hypothetical protein n=1 Tax=Pseudomonas sp. dw_358 TaxID=2720083 RepID=UPI001BD62398|nr:hypothetical protein [Pseudomonas sp. dw_358]